MSEEWEFLTVYQCFHVPNHRSVLNISIMYKVSSEISHDVLLVFYVIETKHVMAGSKKMCRQSELPIHNKLYWFGWDIPKEIFVIANPLNLLNLIDLTSNSRFH